MQQISGERLQDHWSSGLIFDPKHRLRVLAKAVQMCTHIHFQENMSLKSITPQTPHLYTKTLVCGDILFFLIF